MDMKAGMEPTFESASRLFSDLPNIWTPIGWKDHLFRFNVLWNGAVYAQPCLNRRTEQWRGQGVNLTFVPSLDVRQVPFTHGWPAFIKQDDGLVRQGWYEGDAPVLWSEWPFEGLLLRSDVFAHITGGKNVQTGIEPLFAWVRLKVHDSIRDLPLAKDTGFVIRINEPGMVLSMSLRGQHMEYPKYPRDLRLHAQQYSKEEGLLLMEEENKIRMAVAPRQTCSVEFFPPKENTSDALLFIRMPAKIGAHVDLLVSMLPVERSVFQDELYAGRSQALRQANTYWRRKPATAATFCVPEEPVNKAIYHSLKFAELVAEKNPAGGGYSMLTGSLCYTNLWATPLSMTCIMTLDALGYHSVVEKYLEIFRREQGTVVPPGDSFRLHPGYLSSPKSLTSRDWLSDHGALLYTISEHALLSGSRDFIERWTDSIVRACEFIVYARSITGHGGVAGLLPPAVATDCGTKIQAVWNDGWNYKGLVTAARLLMRIGYPGAGEFMNEAADYRGVFQKAFRRRASTMPGWTDKRGRKNPFAPTALSGDQPWETRHPFYLDTGPLFPVYAGLMDAGDPLMRSVLRWFREGPQTDFFRRESNCFQVPCLDYGMSSCEPCYSWNVFHSHQEGDRESFLTAMYSLFAGAMSRKTYTLCETRGGVTGLTPACLQIWMARLAVIDDQLSDNELHLLRFLPLAWCRPGKPAVFKDMPTEFGPVSLRLVLSGDEKTLEVFFSHSFHHAPGKIILYQPPIEKLRYININGKSVCPRKGRVVISPGIENAG